MCFTTENDLHLNSPFEVGLLLYVNELLIYFFTLHTVQIVLKQLHSDKQPVLVLMLQTYQL